MVYIAICYPPNFSYAMLSPRKKRATVHERKQNGIRVFLRGLVQVLKDSSAPLKISHQTPHKCSKEKKPLLINKLRRLILDYTYSY